MSLQTRRRFIESCAALSGIGTLGVLGAGCRREETVMLDRERLLPDDPALGHSVESEHADKQAPDAPADPDAPFEPGYVKLHRTGELKKRGEALWKRMSPCKLCPRTCGVDRLAGEQGFCQATSELVISSHHPHFGEERPLVGRGGSGTVFFTHCSLRCVFCINHEISMGGEGDPATIEDLARMMLRLQAKGCHNINVVTPTHYSPHILLALEIAAGRGLRLPLVYNTCGWEQLEILRILDGVVDVYLPDFKYACGEMAATYSTCVPSDPKFVESEAGARYSPTDIYPDQTKMALLEMHRQVGVARPAADGLVYRGLMIRHLVMPNHVGGSAEVLRWIAANLPKDTYVNVMSQYRPMYRAHEFPAISRPVNRDEYDEAVAAASEAGLTNLEIQGFRFF
jgi:putative pyruvate formate lyase activating enzyme